MELLIENDPANYQRGDDFFLAHDHNYHRKRISGETYLDNWEAYSNRIKHEKRFFDQQRSESLGRLLGKPGDELARSLPSLHIGAGTNVRQIYRARRVESADKVNQVFERTEQELGPPPPTRAVAGRMNPAGIPVFYGATTRETALAEVRPSVGSIVVTGLFRPTRKLRVLDLSKIGQSMSGSIFSPTYLDRAARCSFLEEFEDLIAKPIQPHDEPIEYIPTQVVAEYVSDVLKFDGILYASAQAGTNSDDDDDSDNDTDNVNGYNIVLLGDASLVVGGHLPIMETGVLKVDKKGIEVRRVTGVTYHHERDNRLEPFDEADNRNPFLRGRTVPDL